jgi:hypothetical protein
LCVRSAGRGVRPQDPASGGLIILDTLSLSLSMLQNTGL